MEDRIGRYHLKRRIGAGGMGEVYLAELRGAGGFVRSVALKVIQPQFASFDRIKTMFVREGRALAVLNHRAIVQVLELGSEGETLFLAMEYLDGCTVTELLIEGLLGVPELAFVLSEVARAVAHAHQTCTEDAPAGIVHGDLSPSNVMICTDGAVKVLDFGLARPAGAERSSSSVAGKLLHIAPELISGAPHDALTDVYALGVFAYVALYRTPPLVAANDLEMMQRIIQGIPTEPPAAASLPDGLHELVMSAVAKDRGARIRSCLAFAELLDPYHRGRVTPEHLSRLVAPRAEARAAGEQSKRTARTEDLTVSSAISVTLRRRSPVRLAVAAALSLVVAAAGLSTWLLWPVTPGPVAAPLAVQPLAPAPSSPRPAPEPVVAAQPEPEAAAAPPKRRQPPKKKPIASKPRSDDEPINPLNRPE